MLRRESSLSNVPFKGCHTASGAWPLRPLCGLRKTLSQSQTHRSLRGHAVWHPKHFTIAPLVAICFCVISPSLALAQRAPTTQSASDATLTVTILITEAQRSALRDLGMAPYTMREQAMAAMLADESLTPEAIVELYRLASTPEQRMRLRQVAQHHVIRRLWSQLLPRRQGGTGSLGVIQQSVSDTDANADAGEQKLANVERMGPAPAQSRGAVRVVRTLPGFPGAVHLRPGDVITAVDGKTLAEASKGRDPQDAFRDKVIQSNAGATLRLTVTRDGHEMEIPVQLAPAEALLAVYGRQGLMLLESPYRERWGEFQQKLDGVWPEPAAIAVPWPTNLPPAGAAPVEPLPDANAIGLD